MQTAPGRIDDLPACGQNLVIARPEYLPPYQVGRFALLRAEIEISLAHEGERQHTIFFLNVADDALHVRAVVHLVAQHFRRETQVLLPAVLAVTQAHVCLSDLVAETDSSVQQVSVRAECPLARRIGEPQRHTAHSGIGFYQRGIRGVLVENRLTGNGAGMFFAVKEEMYILVPCRKLRHQTAVVPFGAHVLHSTADTTCRTDTRETNAHIVILHLETMDSLVCHVPLCPIGNEMLSAERGVHVVDFLLGRSIDADMLSDDGTQTIQQCQVLFAVVQR